ncbi:hypothetical protein SEA_EAGLEHORSE_58 [Mycobacterium phage Eaglehorse]|uniref:Uncharacterized protein n=1 Tax=Mycobacterium phage Eaglehorse TaxID=2301611 RepID=A0A385UJ79_9CAUD|nr:hypothetical protein SEA_EAGLEHORSE_58 [Mycobacterium phage Eaglehorse]
MEIVNERSACLECGHAAVLAGRSWVHANGMYRCTNDDGVPLDTWCAGATEEEREENRQRLYEEGVNDCASGHDDLEDSAYERGEADGREDLANRVKEVLATWERKYAGDDDVPGIDLAIELIDQVRGVL